jgi:hypothetical protein
MLMPRALIRLQARRSFRIVVLLLSAFVFAFALRLAWLAFTDPLEIEAREGSVWMHVLAMRVGIDIYATTKVAFVNMNHGPLDPMIKAWLSSWVRALPSYMVTRIFVLLSPILLFISAYFISRKNLAAALLAAGTLFLLFCHMSPMMYVGRSDATALCGLALCGVLADRLLVTRHRSWSNRRYIATQIALGAVSAAVFLTSWRCLPIAAALQFVVLTTQLTDSGRARPSHWAARALSWLVIAAKNFVVSSLLFLAGFAAVWLPVFLIELHGNFRSYYRHFFGFFLADKSGWGTFAGSKFHILPKELLDTRHGILVLFGALTLGGLIRLRRRPAELVAWLLMLTAAWGSVSYGYFKNQGGGGLHYFFESFVLAWIFILHAFGRRRRWGAVAQLVLVALVALTLPHRDLMKQEAMLVGVRQRARTFRREVDELTQGRPIFGEETHLFKKRYANELVDTGDTDQAIARSGYFGEAFTQTYNRYIERLLAHPPKFVIGAMLSESNPERLMTWQLQDLLHHRYTLRLKAEMTAFATGASHGLYERND